MEPRESKKLERDGETVQVIQDDMMQLEHDVKLASSNGGRAIFVPDHEWTFEAIYEWYKSDYRMPDMHLLKPLWWEAERGRSAIAPRVYAWAQHLKSGLGFTVHGERETEEAISDIVAKAANSEPMVKRSTAERIAEARRQEEMRRRARNDPNYADRANAEIFFDVLHENAPEALRAGLNAGFAHALQREQAAAEWRARAAPDPAGSAGESGGWTLPQTNQYTGDGLGGSMRTVATSYGRAYIPPPVPPPEVVQFMRDHTSVPWGLDPGIELQPKPVEQDTRPGEAQEAAMQVTVGELSGAGDQAGDGITVERAPAGMSHASSADDRTANNDVDDAADTELDDVDEVDMMTMTAESMVARGSE